MSHSSRRFYLAVWAALLALLGAGILAGSIRDLALMNAVVFGTAGVKAFLVLRHFMHLRFEPLFVALFLVGAAVCVAILFVALVPDIVLRTGWDRP